MPVLDVPSEFIEGDVISQGKNNTRRRRNVIPPDGDYFAGSMTSSLEQSVSPTRTRRAVPTGSYTVGNVTMNVDVVFKFDKTLVTTDIQLTLVPIQVSFDLTPVEFDPDSDTLIDIKVNK
jgi:hypothetical protein